jgi:3-deoxy-manno-octulosonate cytidylyltransferase (CMP-KDO synthetase)
VADNLVQYSEASVATLCEPLHDIHEVNNPNIVKVVMDKLGMALYFSRAPIPWARGEFPKNLPKQVNCYRHVGMYAYRGEFLQRYTNLGVSPIEQWEALEQLRVLWHGEKIHVGVAKHATLPGVDTYEDLLRVRQYLGDHSK